jgi:hypothetical protein
MGAQAMKVGSSSNLFALRALSANASASSAGSSTAPADNSLAERIKAWQEARVGQSASNSSPRQAALEKAAILKRRLEMLKAMLLFASPEAAKSIASQLKGIAGELAALGKSLGGGGGGGGATIATSSIALPGGETASAATAAETDTDQAAAPTSTEQANAGQTTEAADANNVSDEDDADEQALPGESTPKSDDSALRKAIADAKRLLKELILRTKAKLQEGDAQARRDLQAAEKRLADLDSMTGAGLYTALGGLTADAGAAELSQASALSGGSIDVSA